MDQQYGDQYGGDEFGQQSGDQYGGDGFGQQSGEQFGQTAQGFGGGQSTELRQWGSSSFCSLKNVSTGMYLAAHPDGQLVAEDDSTGHHDVSWNIYSTSDGRVALKSCHDKYLDTNGSSGLPTNNAKDPNRVTWELNEQDQGVYSLGVSDGQYLKAVAPNGDQQQVFLSNEWGQSESWLVEPLNKVMGEIDRIEGKFF